MAIKGSLKEASLPDVLQLLSLGQKTGCLSIADRSNFGYIYFDKGRISYASIVNRRDRLGEILVKHGRITQEQLDAAVHKQGKEHDKKLGQILVSQEVITQEDLERYMRVQIEESVYYLFTWTQGSFNFEVDVRPERQDFLVSINPESLLLEGARRVDEWSLIQKKIPSFDLIFLVDRDRLAISEATLNDAQQRILPLLDGTRDVNKVIEDSGLGRVRDRQGAVRPSHRRYLHRSRSHGRHPSTRTSPMPASKSTANWGWALLQDRNAGRGCARISGGWRSCVPVNRATHFYLGLVRCGRPAARCG